MVATSARWRETQAHSASLDELQRAVKHNGPSSPCVTGFRSLCWKTFLLSKDKRAIEVDWTQSVRDGRQSYTEQRTSLLKYVKHPEALAELTVDPLANDPNSPWEVARQDETVRAEILQDVQRLPDEGSYHDDRIQVMILDILFVYCKLNPSRGGYRQGMHELLAPIVHVIEEDAIDRASISTSDSLDNMMLELLDSSYVEHDAFLLFSKVMDYAQSFYATSEIAGTSMMARSAGPTSSIVERSKFIHDVCLNKVDPELSLHLTSVEILPQIFLIRWIRLLFSREFPFQKSLVLWDTIFALDPRLDLINLICVSMLIRIRWQLLEADYSNCLQLLLKYPPPEQPHGPHTFVDDAAYLQRHLNAAGGATLIMKYTGKLPASSKSPDGSRPTTPTFRGFNAFRQKSFGAKSPLPGTARFTNQQASVEALFQGAAKGAKGVLERGEKLGINQAVRDAMGEIRRNMQAFNEARNASQSAQDMLSGDSIASTFAAIQERNRHLASMLDETVTSLKTLSASNLDNKTQSLDLIEVAAAKVQFVKIYLEDSTMELPIMVGTDVDEEPMDTDEKAESSTAGRVPEAVASPTLPDVTSLHLNESSAHFKKTEPASPNTQEAVVAPDDAMAVDPLGVDKAPTRPAAIPTRSTLAQSSFSWMLEPNEPASSSTSPKVSSSKSGPAGHKKRPSNNASRDKNAFLFGEVTNDSDGRDPLSSRDIFGMEPIKKDKGS